MLYYLVEPIIRFLKQPPPQSGQLESASGRRQGETPGGRMNEYIAKPFQIKQLRVAIKRWSRAQPDGQKKQPAFRGRPAVFLT